jgi:hypothetical protein
VPSSKKPQFSQRSHVPTKNFLPPQVQMNGSAVPPDGGVPPRTISMMALSAPQEAQVRHNLPWKLGFAASAALDHVENVVAVVVRLGAQVLLSEGFEGVGDLHERRFVQGVWGGYLRANALATC